MQYTRLGRTNLEVSTAGLGCGGRSRLGLSKDLGEDNALKIINKAVDLGINFFDTAAIYRTEEILGKGLTGINRDSYIISSKFSPANFGETIQKEGSLTESLDNSLLKLKTDHIDVYLLHGVNPEIYVESRDRFYPELVKAQEKGKIRFTGISEYFNKDTDHKMSLMALQDDIWDVLMVGFNMLNSSARNRVLPLAIEKDVGILDMFAVRTALSNKSRLLEVMQSLQESGKVDGSAYDAEGPLDFLIKNNEAKTVMEAAYRFCRHFEGIDVVLTGTSNVEHLVDNVKSILSPPLSEESLNKIMDIFGDVDSVSCE